MGGEWEKVKDPKAKSNNAGGGRVTRSKAASGDASANARKSGIPKPEPRKPLREKNQQQSNQNSTSAKSQGPLKTLEECSKAIGGAKPLQKEIDGLYERNKDRPNLWLNELVRNLVIKCNLADKYVNKSQYLEASYIPLEKDVEQTLARALKDDSARYIKSHTRATLYHESIISMSEDAARNRPTVGYRVMLQVLAKHYPADCQKSISDRLYFHASQAYAYRSNPSTCMPLLWAMGAPFLAQPAHLTQQPAIDIFERAMIPVAENKPLNHYVVHYFSAICAQANKIDMRRCFLSPSICAKLVDLTFNGKFDAADKAKLENAITGDLVIPAASFEHLLSLLDKNKNAEFKQFVLQVIRKLLESSQGEEACQIWNLNYGSSITESAILLKFLIDEMPNMDKRTRTLLSKTTKQFSKANAKFLESGEKTKDAKQAMAWVDSMCEQVANGGPIAKSKRSVDSGKARAGSGKRTLFGSLFNLVWYLAILYFLIGFTQDLASANWQWSKTSSRQFIAKSHPLVNEKLPLVESKVHQGADFVITRTAKAYNALHDLAPKQFDIIEDYAALASEKVQDACEKYVVPQLNSVYEWIDIKMVEAYIWFKSNEYDVIIMKYVNQVSLMVGKACEQIVMFMNGIAKDAPEYFGMVRTTFFAYYRKLQLAVGKFLLNAKPLAVEYFGIVVAAVEKYWKITVVFVNEHFGTAMKIAGELFDKAIAVLGPLWKQLEQQFFTLFDQINQFIQAQLA